MIHCFDSWLLPEANASSQQGQKNTCEPDKSFAGVVKQPVKNGAG
jgi:hypothetical protein